MFFIVKEYLHYCFRAIFQKQNKSDFIEIFITNILKKNLDRKKEKQIKFLKVFYKENPIKISKEDYGAGSRKKSQSTSISTSYLLKTVVVKEKYGKVLNNLAHFYNAKNVLELGTALGIGSTYLSTVSNKITTIEGNQAISKYVRETFEKQHIKNVEIVNSKFDTFLEDLLNKPIDFDLIFIDGNHSEKATIRYFEFLLKYNKNNSIVIFDDIYWSFGMKNAWNTIRSNNDVPLSIDLFQFGIIFLNADLKQKEHYTLWY